MLCRQCLPGTYAKHGTLAQMATLLDLARHSRRRMCLFAWLAVEATHCEYCPAGTFNDAFGAKECIPCDRGFYSAAGATSCSLCPAGTHSSPAGRTTACTKCLYVGLAPSSDHVAETDLLVVLRAEPAMPRSLARISAKRVRRAPMPLESERPSAFHVRRAPTCTKSPLYEALALND